MKNKLIIFCLASLFSVQLHSQTNLNATLGTFKRSTPIIGFNAQANFCQATWSNQAFRDSVATLKSAMFRYPGGTNSNYWDWQTGWYQNAASTPTWVANLTNTCIVRADEFKLGLTATGAKALMVLNFQYSTINYQIQGLNYALSKGVPIEYIEIGNEHNIYASTEQYMPAGIYSKTAKIWADSLKLNFPNAKICMVGGAGSHSLTTGWLDSIFSQSPNIDALSFHPYLGAGNTDGKFCTKRALSMPFNLNTGLVSRYTSSKFTNSVVPNNIEVWATEYNLAEQTYSCPIQHAATWTHGLYISEMSHLLMLQPKITMLLNHNIANTSDFAAVDMSRNILAGGISMQLLREASMGTDSTATINFIGQANITWSTTSYPSLIGWKFWKGLTENAWICNLSPNAIKISADQIVGTNFSYDSFYEDSAFVVKGIASLKHNLGFSNDSVTLPAFSMNVLKRQASASVKNFTSGEFLKIYPNPTSGDITFELNSEAEIKNVIIYDVLGEIVFEEKETNKKQHSINIKMPDVVGIYFVKIESDSGVFTSKIIKE
jgi:hypothetical protein